MAVCSSSSNNGSDNRESLDLTGGQNNIEHEGPGYMGKTEATNQSGRKDGWVARVYCRLTARIGPA